jgi:hypothetical protein
LFEEELKIALVGVRGFEPPTSASRKQRSTKLSYTPNFVRAGIVISRPIWG